MSLFNKTKDYTGNIENKVKEIEPSTFELHVSHCRDKYWSIDIDVKYIQQVKNNLARALGASPETTLIVIDINFDTHVLPKALLENSVISFNN